VLNELAFAADLWPVLHFMWQTIECKSTK